MQQLRQDLRRVQNLCSSAERELRHEREKNIDLQKKNLLLQQECTKVGAKESLRRAWQWFTGNGSSAALILEQTSCPGDCALPQHKTGGALYLPLPSPAHARGWMLKLDFFSFGNSGQSGAEASAGKALGHGGNVLLSLSAVGKKPAEGQRTRRRALEVLAG